MESGGEKLDTGFARSDYVIQISADVAVMKNAAIHQTVNVRRINNAIAKP